MKIHEIITESIRYAKYIHDIGKVIQDGVEETIKNIGPKPHQYSSPYEKYRNIIDKERSDFNTNVIKDAVKTDIRARLNYFVGQKLQNIATKIILGNDRSYIPVSFKDIPASGQAPELAVDLNTKFIDQLTDQVYNIITDTVWNNWYNDAHSFYDWYWNFIQTTDFSDKIQDSKMKYFIKHWASIFIHELVHVRQHLPQKQRGREYTEYRSYLDDFKGEFLELHSREGYEDERSGRWWDLYSASPQEIEARAHQAAISILDYYVNYPEEIEYMEPEEVKRILSSVPEYIAHSYFKKPQTARERQVYRRYIRKTVEQILDYIEHHKTEK